MPRPRHRHLSHPPPAIVSRIAILLVLALALGACGHKGALYLPKDKPPASQPRPADPPPASPTGESQ